jgi:CO dehydrogenase nickel-insertion accessory protein CooC1
LLRELDDDGRLVLADIEAGYGTLFRVPPGKIDVLVVVVEPSAKAIDVAQRAVALAGARQARVIVVANRLRDEGDLEAIRRALPDHELVPIPEEPAIERADREGVAPIDLDPDAPGVLAMVGLANRIAASAIDDAVGQSEESNHARSAGV